MLHSILTWMHSHPVQLAYPACALVALAAIPLLLARRRQIAAERLLFAAAAGWLLLWTLWSLWCGDYGPGAWWDLRWFHKAGLVVQSGENPYAMRGNPAAPLIQHPPTCLPLFALLARMPFATAGRVWLSISGVALLLLTPLAWRLGRPADSTGADEPFPWAVAACIVASFAAVFGMLAGQMSLWATALLYGAVLLRRCGDRVAAGMGLALATVKPATVLPFLLLLLRRRDWVVWLSLAGSCLALCLIATPAADLPDRLAQNAQVIGKLRQAGGEDDYSFQSQLSQHAISLSRWLYCLGMRDRTWILILQSALLAALAAAIGWAIYGRAKRMPRGAAEALVCLLAVVCLSHKLYDMVLLALPLWYCVEQARQSAGWRRRGLAACVLGLLVALNLPGHALAALTTWSQQAGGWGFLAQALVLPCTVWVALFCMALIVGASCCRSAESSP